MARRTHTYRFECCGVDCGHHHLSHEAAEACGRRLIRAARRGERFWGSDRLAEENEKIDLGWAVVMYPVLG